MANTSSAAHEATRRVSPNAHSRRASCEKKFTIVGVLASAQFLPDFERANSTGRERPRAPRRTWIRAHSCDHQWAYYVPPCRPVSVREIGRYAGAPSDRPDTPLLERYLRE